ncbi:MAG: hemolysin family protein [Phycisphaerales bacterium]|nr:hemolysin family protein [Phycisphaerales bacterium]
MNELFWIATAVAWVLAIWTSTLARWLRTGRRHDLAERLGGEESPRWLRLEPGLDDAVEILTVKAVFFNASFLVCWLISTDALHTQTPWIIGSACIALLLLWIGPVSLANAMARYVGASVARRSLFMLRSASLGGKVVAWLPRLIDEIVKRLSGANLREHGRNGDPESDLLRSIEQQQREGVIDEGAATLLENVVDFASTDVGEVMTPRTEIEGIEFTDDLAVIRSFIREEGHSRIPVFEEDLDHIAGILYVKDLVPFLGEDATDFALRPLLRTPIVVPDTKPVQDLLADFQRAEVHMAIVVDEYGGTAGLVTIEDVLEEIVGEIYDEHEDGDDEEPDLAEYDDGTWQVDARFHIDDFNEAIGVDLPEDDEYDTVGGWALAISGQVPDPGSVIEGHGLLCTVLEAQPTHIVRLKVERISGGE